MNSQHMMNDDGKDWFMQEWCALTWNAVGQIQKSIASFHRWNVCRLYFAYNLPKVGCIGDFCGSFTYRLVTIVCWLIVAMSRRQWVVISVVPYSKEHLAMVQNHYSNLIQSTLYDHLRWEPCVCVSLKKCLFCFENVVCVIFVSMFLFLNSLFNSLFGDRCISFSSECWA